MMKPYRREPRRTGVSGYEAYQEGASSFNWSAFSGGCRGVGFHFADRDVLPSGQVSTKSRSRVETRHTSCGPANGDASPSSQNL
jgi:hypothetical protein